MNKSRLIQKNTMSQQKANFHNFDNEYFLDNSKKIKSIGFHNEKINVFTFFYLFNIGIDIDTLHLCTFKTPT